ncbi:hypothetical protein C8R46DRAFT_1227774 [Mycena filopes]|nr:hypothetical protein C8R46DRAFT_1227774 [Mycena filopes]
MASPLSRLTCLVIACFISSLAGAITGMLCWPQFLILDAAAAAESDPGARPPISRRHNASSRRSGLALSCES